MNFAEVIQTPVFWTGLITIIWVNVILSGDNAVVIALAARSLPEKDKSKAVFWGAGIAVLLRIMLTSVAVFLMRLPYLKIIGGLLLMLIAVKLLDPHEEDCHIAGENNLFKAIKTIIFADLVMSLDNVIAVAAAANGDFFLLVIGLMLSIPCVIFGAAMLMHLMQRFPIIITLGAAMIGWVAGDMIVTDPVTVKEIALHIPGLYHWLPAPLNEELIGSIIGATLVLGVGKWLAKNAELSGHDHVENAKNNQG